MKRSRIRRLSFSERYPPDHPGLRYGPLFRAVRDQARLGLCALCELGYDGPAHRVQDCSWGELPGRTAHHVGRTDADGLLPVSSGAHALLHGRCGESNWKHFAAWLEENNLTIESIGLDYVDKARGIPE